MIIEESHVLVISVFAVMREEPRTHSTHIGRSAIISSQRFQAVHVLGISICGTDELQQCLEDLVDSLHSCCEQIRAKGANDRITL